MATWTGPVPVGLIDWHLVVGYPLLGFGSYAYDRMELGTPQRAMRAMAAYEPPSVQLQRSS